ncbi:MAG: hypothetical protein ACOYMK_10275 [Hyphomonadaceae bacterium]
MTLWKTALAGAVLGLAACQPVGVPVGEERLAAKIADVVINEGMTAQFARQQVQGLMYQGSISQDQVNQTLIAINREMESKLPDVKTSLVASLSREFNIKELDFLHKLLVSKEGKAVVERQEIAMQDPMALLDGLAKEAATRAVARVNSGWPTGAAPAPPPQPEGVPQLPPGMVLPN